MSYDSVDAGCYFTTTSTAARYYSNDFSIFPSPILFTTLHHINPPPSDNPLMKPSQDCTTPPTPCHSIYRENKPPINDYLIAHLLTSLYGRDDDDMPECLGMVALNEDVCRWCANFPPKGDICPKCGREGIV